MTHQSTYERFLHTTFPTLFASAVDLLGDEDEAAIVAQRLILRAYYDDRDATRPAKGVAPLAEVA